MAEAARVMQWSVDGTFTCVAILLMDSLLAAILIAVAASRPITEGDWILEGSSA